MFIFLVSTLQMLIVESPRLPVMTISKEIEVWLIKKFYFVWVQPFCFFYTRDELVFSLHKWELELDGHAGGGFVDAMEVEPFSFLHQDHLSEAPIKYPAKNIWEDLLPGAEKIHFRFHLFPQPTLISLSLRQAAGVHPHLPSGSANHTTLSHYLPYLQFFFSFNATPTSHF